MFDAPHGAICARLLPFVIEQNILSLQMRDPTNVALRRYQEIFHIFGYEKEDLSENIDDFISYLSIFEVKPLSTYGIGRQHLQEIIGMAIKSSSMKANPIVLTEHEIENILMKAL